MKTRDLILAFLLPLVLLTILYFYVKKPEVYRPPVTISRFHSGQSVTIVFLGDSITYGYGTRESYVYQFRMFLKYTTAFDRTRLINAGVPGDTVADGLARLDQTVLSYKPDLVYIQFGGNELRNRVPLSEFEKNLREMVQTIRSKSSAEIVIMTMPIFDIPLIQKPIQQYNEVIRKVAKDNNVGCLDIYKVWKKNIGWFGSAADLVQGDHIHPNEKGHQLISQAIWANLE